MNMHICHINLASGFGGGERQTLLLIQEQIKLGYQITVVANPKSPFVNEIERLNCRLFLAKGYLRQHKHIITKSCNLIHVHEGRAIYWALIQSKLFNIPYIITRRIDNPLKKKWLSNKAYSNASALIGLSNSIINKIEARYSKHNIYQIPDSPVSYPINKKTTDNLKESHKGKILVIQAGTMINIKGFDTTIDAAKLLIKKEPKIHFILLGDGSEKNRLMQKSKDKSNITFAGRQSNMGDWFKIADILIQPSYKEGLGSAILEAIAAQLPVIGTNVGGIPDIIENNISGLLVEPKNAQELADAIYKIATDKPLRHKLIKGGKEKIASFDIKYTSLQYQNLYQKIIDEKTNEK